MKTKNPSLYERKGVPDMDNTGFAETFSNEYLQKVFYFCLKKTSDVHQAEDLCQDIALNVLTELRRGTVIDNFPAWVWRIARSRYGVWADRKHRQNENVINSDISELDVPGDGDVLSDVIQNEQLALLRRELSFISSEYRQLLVAYYINGQRIRVISENSGIPEGTVMRRLYNARNMLKEGMSMAREFGKRSYDPEDISFVGSGNHTSGLPDKVIHRKIPKNILCEAHNNPSTAEELAMELGIALPYMEEEVEILYNAELLKKVGKDKYITNFFIVPAECQNKCFEYCCEFAEENYANIWELAGMIAKKAKEKGVTFGDYTDEDIQMFFALELENELETDYDHCRYKEFKRKDGGSWGIIGFEQKGIAHRLDGEWFNGNSCGKGDLQWAGFQTNDSARIFTEHRYKNDVPDNMYLSLMKGIAEGRTDFSDTENKLVEELINQGFCVKRGGKAYINAVTYTRALCDEIVGFMKGTKQYKALEQNAAKLDSTVYESVKKYANPYIEEDIGYYGYMNMKVREILARLLHDKGCYKGKSGQFCEFVY